MSQACRLLKSIVDTAVTIQYKIALARTGMIDGDAGQRSESVACRLQKLRDFWGAWPPMKMHFFPLMKRESAPEYVHDTLAIPWCCIWPSSGGTFPYLDGPSLKLFRPPSSSRGIPARMWSFRDLPIPVSQIIWCGVDPAQDLLVLAKEFREDDP